MRIYCEAASVHYAAASDEVVLVVEDIHGKTHEIRIAALPVVQSIARAAWGSMRQMEQRAAARKIVG